MDNAPLEVDIFQTAPDELMKANRRDGTGWDWSWAGWQRPWMDNTPGRFAYRCLPLTIANQTGWWINNPIGFTAIWNGEQGIGSVQFQFDSSPEIWSRWIRSHFGSSIVTWNTPFLFRTKPEGSRLLVCGPWNSIKHEAQALTGLIESDWMTMSFTMNWMLTVSNQKVRFEQGEPIFQAIPLFKNVCADLETAKVTYQKISESPEVAREYAEWTQSRDQFLMRRIRGENLKDDWQKDYFRGVNVTGNTNAVTHMTKIKPPSVQYSPSTRSVGSPDPKRPRSSTVRLPWQSAVRPSLPKIEPPFSHTVIVSTTFDEVSDPSKSDRQASNPSISKPSATRIFDNSWRRWIAENLLLDVAPQGILETMTAAGFSQETVAAEIDKALENPYFQGADQLRMHLEERDRILFAYRKLQRLHHATARIEQCRQLSRADFLARYYSANRPVILTGWLDAQALQNWNLDRLAERLGEQPIAIEVINDQEPSSTTPSSQQTLAFREFLSKIHTLPGGTVFQANRGSINEPVLMKMWQEIPPLAEYLDKHDLQSVSLELNSAGTRSIICHETRNRLIVQIIGRKWFEIVPAWETSVVTHSHQFDDETNPNNLRSFEGLLTLRGEIGPGEILFVPVGYKSRFEDRDTSLTFYFVNFIFDNNFI